MEKNQTYIDYQEVSPSPLHLDLVKERCILGEKGGEKPTQFIEIKPVSKGERLLMKLQDPLVWRRVGRQARPVARFVGIVMGIVAFVCMIGFVVYRLAVLVRDAAVALWVMIVDSGALVYMGIGFATLLVLYAAWSVRTSVRTSVPFDDWKPRTPTPTHTSGSVRQDGSDNIYVHVNVNKK